MGIICIVKGILVEIVCSMFFNFIEYLFIFGGMKGYVFDLYEVI